MEKKTKRLGGWMWDVAGETHQDSMDTRCSSLGSQASIVNPCEGGVSRQTAGPGFQAASHITFLLGVLLDP